MGLLGLMHDPNKGGSKGQKSQTLELEEEDPSAIEVKFGEAVAASTQEAFRQSLSAQREDGKAAPDRLTQMQRVYVKKLVDKYGTDVQAMARDIKLNRMQHSPDKLRQLVRAFLYHYQGGAYRSAIDGLYAKQ
eukprot:scaffold7377_cov389-Prasinococcus_capsulatus_cf.AAC.26